MAKSQVMTPSRAPSQVYLMLAIGIVAASLAANFILLAQDEGVPSLFIAAGRLTVAALVLTPAVLRNSRYAREISSLSRADVILIAICGFFLAIHFAAWVSSLEYATVLVSLVLVSTSPIWVALLEVFLLHMKLARPVIIGLVVVLVGGIIIGLAGTGDEATNGNNNQFIGGALALIGAIAVAVYLIIGRKIRRQLSLTPYIWLVYGMAALLLLLAVILTGTPMTGHSFEGYAWIVVLALVPQLIGHSSFNYALAYLPATYVSIASQMEPVLGSMVALVLFDQIPGFGQIIGGLIIIAGVVMTTLGQHQPDAA
jgi:drug/metabolite transporter (DMT)-like permease